MTTVQVPDPGPGEALVAVRACGACHTDLHYREGGIGNDFPTCSGTRPRVWSRPSAPECPLWPPGDFVILNWRAVCGRCRACRRGRPWYCFATHNATQKMALVDGTPLAPALGIGVFADKTLVAAGQCTKVDPGVPAAVAGLLGCGIMAGLGAALNTGGVSRGDSVAVFGCGGVGNAAIAGSVLAGATTIIAVDVNDTKRLRRTIVTRPGRQPTPATAPPLAAGPARQPPQLGAILCMSIRRSIPPGPA